MRVSDDVSNCETIQNVIYPDSLTCFHTKSQSVQKNQASQADGDTVINSYATSVAEGPNAAMESPKNSNFEV